MESCGKSAVKLVTLVARHFPGIFVFLHFPLKLSNCSYGIFLRLCWVLRKNREKKGKVIFFFENQGNIGIQDQVDSQDRAWNSIPPVDSHIG